MKIGTYMLSTQYGNSLLLPTWFPLDKFKPKPLFMSLNLGIKVPRSGRNVNIYSKIGNHTGLLQCLFRGIWLEEKQRRIPWILRYTVESGIYCQYEHRIKEISTAFCPFGLALCHYVELGGKWTESTGQQDKKYRWQKSNLSFLQLFRVLTFLC